MVDVVSTSETAVSELRQHVQQLDAKIEGLEQGQSRLEGMLEQVLSTLNMVSAGSKSGCV